MGSFPDGLAAPRDEPAHFGFRVSDFGFRFSVFGFLSSGFGFRVSGLGVRERAPCVS